MRVLYLSGRELSYQRNDVLLRALRRFSTVEVVGETGPGSLVLRSFRVVFKALPRLLTERYDLIVVGFYGYLLMLPVWKLARGAPVIFDAFVSNYDTLCFDRAVIAPNSLPGRLAFWLDRTSCRLAQHVLLDTSHHIDYFVQTFDLSAELFTALPVGCNEELFHPQPVRRQASSTQVLYYSTYLPLHGVETVVRAAAMLKHEPLHFRLIGTGPEYDHVYDLAQQLGLHNITFVPSVPVEMLPLEIANSDICLGGHFGTSHKAARVVPGKVYQILAMARPLIATDTPANKELLCHGESAYLCPPADPQELANGILELKNNSKLRVSLATGGRKRYLEQCSEAIITQRLNNLLARMQPNLGLG